MKETYWYSVTVQFNFEDENTGKVKRIKEIYLVSATCITEAETLVIKDLSENNDMEYRILKVDESKIVKVIS